MSSKLGLGLWYKYFLYISLLFLAIALYQNNYLRIPHIFSFKFAVTSILLLFGGYFCTTVAWNKLINNSISKVDLSECLAGTGLSVFGKYVPGKIWTVVGRAAYIADRKKSLRLANLSSVSLQDQLIAIWSGLTFGAVGFFFLDEFPLWSLLAIVIWLGLTAAIFSNLVNRMMKYSIGLLLRKKVELSTMTMRSVFGVLPWHIGYWALWAVGFYLFAVSITKIEIPWHVAFAFPLGVTVSMLALVIPGGLGMREGILAGYLVLTGIPLTEATTISIVSRLWFLIGEVFIFIAGWMTHKMISFN